MLCRSVIRALGQRDARRAIAFSYNYGHMFCPKATIFLMHQIWRRVPTYSRIQDKGLFETGMNILRNRHWLEYDFVALVVLFGGIGFVALIVLGI